MLLRLPFTQSLLFTLPLYSRAVAHTSTTAGTAAPRALAPSLAHIHLWYGSALRSERAICLLLHTSTAITSSVHHDKFSISSAPFIAVNDGSNSPMQQAQRGLSCSPGRASCSNDLLVTFLLPILVALLIIAVISSVCDARTTSASPEQQLASDPVLHATSTYPIMTTLSRLSCSPLKTTKQACSAVLTPLQSWSALAEHWHSGLIRLRKRCRL